MGKNEESNQNPNLIHVSDKEHGSLNKSVLLVACLLVIVYLVIFIWRLNHISLIVTAPNYWQVSTDLLSTITSLVATAFAVAWLSVAIERETKNTFLMRMRNLIVESSTLSDETIEQMNIHEKKHAIRKIARNILGSDNEHVYNFLKESLDKSVSGWRNNLIYDTKLEKHSDDCAHMEEKYILNQSFSYTMNSISKEFEYIKIGFAFSKEILEKWLKEDDWFFREQIYPEIYYARYELNDESSALAFVKNNLKFKALAGTNKSEAVVIDYSLNHIQLIRDQGIVFKYNLPKAINRSFYANIRFSSFRKNKHFLVTLPTITRNARIEMLYDDNKFKVDGYEFLTTSSDVDIDRSNDNGKCTVEVKNSQWLFPVSGIMFVWEDKP